MHSHLLYPDGGLSAAFKAWKRYQEDMAIEDELNLPGIDLNADQLFFVSYGRTRCDLWTSTYYANYKGTHSPGYGRVIGPLRNSPQFAETFNCPVDFKMNPKDNVKCCNSRYSDANLCRLSCIVN